MAFINLVLTTDGMALYAKAQQGKPLHFTRVALGDGLLGGGSLVNRSALISERMSMSIDAIQLVEDSITAAIIATLSNEGMSQGFYARELGVFAEDPDTHQEKSYLYSHAGSDGEYIPDGNSGTLVYERLKLLVKLENTGNVTFEASGNPLYLVPEDVAPIVQASLSGTTAKTTLVDNDTLPLSDSADGLKLKKITFANIKAALKSYFDTLYNNYVHPTTAGNKHIPANGSNDQILRWGASGTAVWGVDNDTITEIVDNLTSTDSSKALSAKQGKALNDSISDLFVVDQILLRDILRIKMKQTGLNLDPNAWSDTLEDTTGINTAISTISYDSTNKSIKSSPASTIGNGARSGGTDFNANTTKLGQPFTTNGAINMPISTIHLCGCSAPVATPPAGPSVFNLRIETDNGGKPSGTLAHANAVKNNESMPYAGPGSVNYFDVTFNNSFTLSPSTKYWIVMEFVSNKIYWYPCLSSADACLQYYSGTWQYWLGKNSYFFIDQAAFDATAYWNAVQSEGILKKAIVEAIATGTITYHISRDGGTTFTQCTLDTAMDISEQPEGTSIVLKAFLTGNSELLAISWGGVN